DLREGSGGRIVVPIPERERRVHALCGLGRLRAREERPIEKARQIRELVLRERREDRVVRAGRLVHPGRQPTTPLSEIPAAVPFLGETRAARRRRRRNPGSRNRAIDAREIAGFGARAVVATIGEVDRPDESWPIQAELLRLLKRECHLRASFVQEERQERRELG